MDINYDQELHDVIAVDVRRMPIIIDSRPCLVFMKRRANRGEHKNRSPLNQEIRGALDNRRKATGFVDLALTKTVGHRPDDKSRPTNIDSPLATSAILHLSRL